MEFSKVFDQKSLRPTSRGKGSGVLVILNDSWLFRIGKLFIKKETSGKTSKTVAVAAKESPPLYLEDLRWEFFRLVDEIARIKNGPGYKHHSLSMHVPKQKYQPGPSN